jgi:bifunctional enzyme CysN/CysC
MPWYSGPTLMELLESARPAAGGDHPFCMPVQWVIRTGDFRGLAGTVAAGAVERGGRIAVLPAGTEATVRRIAALDGDIERAGAEQTVCVELAEDVDVCRGDMLVDAAVRPEVADQFSADVVWLDTAQLVAGRTYVFRHGTSEGMATITELSHRVDLSTLEPTPAKKLDMNEVGRIKVSLNRPISFAPYAEQRDLGGFLLIDRVTARTLGAGMIRHSLRRSHNIFWQDFELNKAAHAAQKGQTPRLVWFTGLSASGKSTVANLVAKALYARGRHVYILDGDNLRFGLNKDLGFTEGDRAENVRRASEVAKLMVDAGLIVLAAFISPYRDDRLAIRERFGPGEFVEVFVDTPVEVCAARDHKGLYAKAMAGELVNFTGVTAPFEAPENPEIRLDGRRSVEGLAAETLAYLGWV